MKMHRWDSDAPPSEPSDTLVFVRWHGTISTDPDWSIVRLGEVADMAHRQRLRPLAWCPWSEILNSLEVPSAVCVTASVSIASKESGRYAWRVANLPTGRIVERAVLGAVYSTSQLSDLDNYEWEQVTTLAQLLRARDRITYLIEHLFTTELLVDTVGKLGGPPDLDMVTL